MSRNKAARGGVALAPCVPVAPPALVTQSLTLVEAAIGGRHALVAALAYAPKSTDLAYLLGLIGDPEHVDTPLAQLCAMGGITAGELLEAYKSGELNRAQAVGMSVTGARLPDVIADTFKRALPSEAACSECGGVGQTTAEPSKRVPNPEPQECRACHGSGRLLYEGDLEHKKLALDMGKVLQKGGPTVALQVNQHIGVNVGVAGGALERLQAATDRVLYSDEASAAPAIEAEVIEPALTDADIAPEAMLDDYDEGRL